MTSVCKETRSPPSIFWRSDPYHGSRWCVVHATLPALQLYLEHEGLESSGPRAVIKRAFVMRLIPDQDEGDAWLQMLDDRNLTSQAYDEALAVRIYTRIVHDYAPRLSQMAKKIQTLRWD